MEHTDEAPLDPGLLAEWDPTSEPPHDFADLVVQRWSVESPLTAADGTSASTAPYIGGAAESSTGADMGAPVAWWKASLVGGLAAGLVAVLGLAVLNPAGSDTMEPPEPPRVADTAAAPAASMSEDVAALEAQLAAAQAELSKLRALHASCKSSGLAKLPPTGGDAPRVQLAGRGVVLGARGAKVELRRIDKETLVVAQDLGSAEYQLTATETVLVVTPAGSLTVRGTSFTVVVPSEGEGEVTIRPKAGQAVVATASGTATLMAGEKVAIANRAEPKAHKRRKARSKSRLKAGNKRRKASAVMTF